MRPVGGINSTDILIIGAGPGGLQLARDLHRFQADYLVLEGSDVPGNFFRHYPRHRKLISVNKYAVAQRDNPLRFDWNSLLTDEEELQFPRYSKDYWPAADDFLRYLADFSAPLNIRYNAPVRGIEAVADAGFVVTLSDGTTLVASRVVVATGMAPYLPPIPGIEYAESYADVSVDPAEFADTRVLIIGKGNSAFETADPLLPVAHTVHMVSPETVRFAWNTHYVGHLRAINNHFIDTYQLKLGNALLDAEITEIRHDDAGFHVDLAYTHAAGHRATYHYDRVIASTGFRFGSRDILAGLGIETIFDGKFPAMTSSYESLTVPGLFFAGTITHSRDYRKTMSGFIHGFRYNSRFLAQLLASGGALPSERSLPIDPAALAGWALDRLNTSDAIFLQPGYHADVVTVDGGRANVYLSVPIDWVRDGGLGQGWQVAVTLAYGPPAPDPLRVERSPDPSYATVTPFLHPVLHLRRNGRDVEELHLLEDLENHFDSDVYLPQLLTFFQAAMIHEMAVN